MTLREAIDKAERDFLYIGARAAFLFIGRKKDAVEWLAEVDDYAHYSDRTVKEVYERELVEPFGTVILFEGNEAGRYWLYSEYEKAMERKRRK